MQGEIGRLKHGGGVGDGFVSFLSLLGCKRLETTHLCLCFTTATPITE